MPASRRLYTNQEVVFHGWEGGEFDQLPPYMTHPDSYTGLNVVRYPGGALGPRYGLKQLTLSGVAMTGVILGMGFNSFVSPGNDTWIVIGTAIFLMNSGTGAVVATTGAVLAVTPTHIVNGMSLGGITYIGNDTDKMYSINHATGVVTALAASPSTCALVCQYGENTLVSGQTTAINQVKYSAPSDPTTWPAANFFNVGTGARITGMWTQRDHVMIATSDGGWWVVRGTLANSNANALSTGTATLRRVGDNISPLFPENAAVLVDGNLAMALGSAANGSISSLAEHTGSKLIESPAYLFFGNGRGVTFPNPSHSVRASKESADWIAFAALGLGTNTMVQKTRGSWSKHTFSPSGVSLLSYASGSPVADQWILTDGGAVAVTPKFFYYRQYANRPAFTTDTTASPGDASTTPMDSHFSTPEHTSEVDYQMAPLEVAVDFLEWSTGQALSNHFDVSITSQRMVASGDGVTPSGSFTTPTIPYDNSAATVLSGIGAIGTGPVRRRMRFGFSNAQWCNSFTINFAAMRGVAIERVLVHFTNQLTRE